MSMLRFFPARIQHFTANRSIDPQMSLTTIDKVCEVHESDYTLEQYKNFLVTSYRITPETQKQRAKIPEQHFSDILTYYEQPSIKLRNDINVQLDSLIPKLVASNSFTLDQAIVLFEQERDTQVLKRKEKIINALLNHTIAMIAGLEYAAIVYKTMGFKLNYKLIKKKIEERLVEYNQGISDNDIEGFKNTLRSKYNLIDAFEKKQTNTQTSSGTTSQPARTRTSTFLRTKSSNEIVRSKITIGTKALPDDSTTKSKVQLLTSSASESDITNPTTNVQTVNASNETDDFLDITELDVDTMTDCYVQSLENLGSASFPYLNAHSQDQSRTTNSSESANSRCSFSFKELRASLSLTFNSLDFDSENQSTIKMSPFPTEINQPITTAFATLKSSTHEETSQSVSQRIAAIEQMTKNKESNEFAFKKNN